jgi:hypothetical protein
MKIVFTSGYDTSDDEITKIKGHRSDVLLIDEDNNYYELNFVTLSRLDSDLMYNIGNGKKYFTDICLIILEEVTKDAILNCVTDLSVINYFKRFTPIEKPEEQEEWAVFPILNSGLK